MERLDIKDQDIVCETQNFDGFLVDIFKAEAETAKAEANIINKVEFMLDTITNLMQMINPVEEHYTTIDDTNNYDSVKLTLNKERVINEKVIENLNNMADSLAKVLRGLSDLIGESLDALGDCKEARSKLIESLSQAIKT